MLKMEGSDGLYIGRYEGYAFGFVYLFRFRGGIRGMSAARCICLVTKSRL